MTPEINFYNVMDKNFQHVRMIECGNAETALMLAKVKYKVIAPIIGSWDTPVYRTEDIFEVESKLERKTFKKPFKKKH